MHLDAVPNGATLDLTFGPTMGVKLSWLLSGLALISLSAWLINPSVVVPLAKGASSTFDGLTARLRRRLKWDEEN
jgi:hypothetical protein